MSTNEGHRPVRREKDTLLWQAGDIYEHHLSGRRVTQLPPGEEARARPDTIPGVNDSQGSQGYQSSQAGGSSSHGHQGRRKGRRV